MNTSIPIPLAAVRAVPADGSMMPEVTAALAPAAIVLAAMTIVAAAILLVARDGRGTTGRWRVPADPCWIGGSTWAWPRRLTVGLVLALWATAASAQGVADHLQCFKVTDVTREHLEGIVDLDAPSMHPGARTWPAPPFHAFASTTLGYRCTYDNPSTRTITTGPSQQTDEQCIAVGYFLPATRPVMCYDGFVLP